MIVPYDCPSCGETIKGELTKETTDADCPKCGKSSRIPMGWVEPGITLGNGYRIEKKLDEDSHAKLFLACQEAMDRMVVLKILPPEVAANVEEFDRFQREIKLAANIAHPNILSAYGAGEDNGIYFLIRQHKEGQTLEEYCRQNESMPEKELLTKMIPIAEALKHAWDEKRILHRNLKPENILLAEDGTFLSDLGIAKSMEKSDMEITRVGFTVGTPEYMSPEQVRGDTDLDCRSDIYSFCTVLYRALTGVVPFEDKSPMVVMQKQLNDVPIPAQFKNNSISTECSSMLDKGLAKDREDRQADWDELIKQMKKIVRGEQPRRKDPKKATAKPRKVPQKKKKRPAARQGVNRQEVERIAEEMYGYKKNRVLLYLVATLLPILLFGLGYMMYQKKKDREQRVEVLFQEVTSNRESEKFDTALKKLEEIQRLAPINSPPYTKAAKLMNEVQIERVMWLLNEQSQQRMRTQGYNAAISVYTDYNGPYAGETAKLRRKAADRLRRQR